MAEEERPIGTATEDEPAPKVKAPEAEKPPETKESKPQEGEEKPKEFKGQFSSQEEAEKALREHQSLTGRQATELGQTRVQLNTAIEQLNEAKAEKAEKTDFGAEVDSLKKQVRNNDIELDEMVSKVVELSVGQASEVMNERMDARLDDRDAQDLADKFKADNPDFEELRQDGTLDRIAQGPKGAFVKDYKEAYLLFKRAEAQDQVVKLQGEIETAKAAGVAEGQAEIARVAQGAAGASSVLSEPGQIPVSTTPEKRTTRKQEEAGAFAALDKMRAAKEAAS